MEFLEDDFFIVKYNSINIIIYIYWTDASLEIIKLRYIESSFFCLNEHSNVFLRKL